MTNSHKAFISAPLPLTRSCHGARTERLPRKMPPTWTTPRRCTLRMAASDPKAESIPVPLAPKVSDVWELDFYSRPVVGLDGKKLWELIIVDSEGNFEHVEAIPNSMVNSRELRARVQAVIDEAPSKPKVVRFFRVQMLNMIQIALSEIDVQVSPSRKTYALFQFLKDREENVYRSMPGFQEALSRQAISFSGIDMVMTQRLPDALRCESFAFGSFPLGQLEEFFASADPNEYFGDRCLVDPNVPKDAMVPGLIVFSKRAYPLSAWISGIELAFIRTVPEKQEIVMECGLNVMYRFAKITDDLKEDVRKFQAGKEKTGGLHFLAVQTNAEAEEIDGMWLLCDS